MDIESLDPCCLGEGLPPQSFPLSGLFLFLPSALCGLCPETPGLTTEVAQGHCPAAPQQALQMHGQESHHPAAAWLVPRHPRQFPPETAKAGVECILQSQGELS